MKPVVWRAVGGQRHRRPRCGYMVWCLESRGRRSVVKGGEKIGLGAIGARPTPPPTDAWPSMLGADSRRLPPGLSSSSLGGRPCTAWPMFRTRARRHCASATVPLGTAPGVHPTRTTELRGKRRTAPLSPLSAAGINHRSRLAAVRWVASISRRAVALGSGGVSTTVVATTRQRGRAGRSGPCRHDAPDDAPMLRW